MLKAKADPSLMLRMTRVGKTTICALLLLLLTLCYSNAIAYEGDRGEASKFYKSGQKHEAKENFGRALNAYYHAIVMDPDYAVALRSIGRVYARKGLNKNALDALNQAVFLDKDDPETHFYLGIVYPLVEHKNDKALEHFQKYLKLSPGDSKRRQQVEKWVEKTLRTANLQQDTGRIAHPSPSNSEATTKEESEWHNKGVELAGAGKHQDAAAAFSKALALNPKYADAHYGLGAAYASLGNKPKAITEYWTYLALKPNASDLEKVIDRIATLEKG